MIYTQHNEITQSRFAVCHCLLIWRKQLLVFCKQMRGRATHLAHITTLNEAVSVMLMCASIAEIRAAPSLCRFQAALSPFTCFWRNLVIDTWMVAPTLISSTYELGKLITMQERCECISQCLFHLLRTNSGERGDLNWGHSTLWEVNRSIPHCSPNLTAQF